MQTFEIKHRYTGAVLYAAGGETLRDVVIKAVASSADLRGADLLGADLSSAYLLGAYLSSAGRKTLTLIGERPLLIIGPIGSRCDYMTAHLTDAGVYVRAGCFFGALAEFRSAVVTEHGDSEHGREYLAAIAMIGAHAAIWTPADVAAEVA